MMVTRNPARTPVEGTVVFSHYVQRFIHLGWLAGFLPQQYHSKISMVKTTATFLLAERLDMLRCRIFFVRAKSPESLWIHLHTYQNPRVSLINSTVLFCFVKFQDFLHLHSEVHAFNTGILSAPCEEIPRPQRSVALLSRASDLTDVGRDVSQREDPYIIPQKAIYKWYILPIGGLYATYHLLWEPETTIESIET